MEEFTNAIGWKIFYSVIGVIMLVFSIFLFTSVTDRGSTLLIAFPVIILLFGLFIIASQIKNKVMISADSIIKVSVFGRKELTTADVKGCRISTKVIVIEPLSPTDPKITLNNYSDLANSEDLVTWLNQNFKDLDAVDMQEQKDQILHDTSLGFTEQEREEKLKKAKQIALVYNIGGGVAGAAVLFLQTNNFLIILSLAYPLIGLAVMKFNGLIKFFTNPKSSIYPSIFLGFYFAALMSFIPAISQYDLFSYEHVWLPVIVVGLVIVGLLYMGGGNPAAGAVKGQFIFMIVLGALYGFGSIINVNCAFDKSTPQKFVATVVNHEVHHGKSTTYYLTLSPWGPQKETKDVSVGSGFYYATNVGETVNIYLKKGVLNIPWFVVSHY